MLVIEMIAEFIIAFIIFICPFIIISVSVLISFNAVEKLLKKVGEWRDGE